MKTAEVTFLSYTQDPTKEIGLYTDFSPADCRLELLN